MLAYNVTPDAIRASASEVGIQLGSSDGDLRPSGRAWRFTLATMETGLPKGAGRTKQPYSRLGFQRRKNGERRAIAGPVCWHGHRDFFRALFRRCPDARIVTALATYKGSEHFEATYPDSDRNIGSMMDPMYASEACRCNEGCC